MPIEANQAGSLLDDQRDVRPGLDVVQVRRLVPEAVLDRVDVLRARLADLSFERGHQGRRLAADEGSAAAADVDVEVEAAAEDVRSEEPHLPRLLERELQILDRQAVLVAHVDVAGVGADREGPDDHPLDDRVGIPFQDRPVHEGPGIAFIGVADHVLGLALGLPAGLPLASRRESAAAAPAQARVLDLLDDLFGIHRRQGLGHRLVAAERM